MRKNRVKLLFLGFILAGISFSVILIFGKEYELKFYNVGKEDSVLTIENDSGEVEVLKEKKEKNSYFVKVVSKKPGKVSILLQKGEFQEIKVLYVHKSMIITENTIFGKSTFSEIIPLSLSVFLSYFLYLFIKKYRKGIKENLYQYKNIAYLGIIIFTSFFLFRILLSLRNYQGLYETVDSIIHSMLFVSNILFPVAFLFFLLVTVSSIHLIIKEGKSLKNLLGLFLGIFLCLSTILPNYIYSIVLYSQKIDISNLNGPGPYLYNFFESLLYLTISYLECIFIGTIVIALKSIRKKVEENIDYIIILGCKIRKDKTLPPLLKGRVDKALDFRNKQLEDMGKDLVFIASGGKGVDEVISEAEAIKEYLLAKGISEKNILVENQSRNTYENIRFSYQLIKEKDAKIAFSTTNYHVLRSGLIASEQGLRIEGMGSNTKAYYWINAFIREFIGTLYAEKRKHLSVFLLIILILIIMIIITYFANNI